MDSYIRRQRWLHEQQAVLMLNAYAEAMSGGRSGTAGNAPVHHNGSVATNPEDDIFARSVKVK